MCGSEIFCSLSKAKRYLKGNTWGKKVLGQVEPRGETVGNEIAREKGQFDRKSVCVVGGFYGITQVLINIFQVGR